MQAPLMEETRYWMWTRTKLSGSLYESWEEKAFAEDTAAHLGGSIWPPRSYSCNFCRREFRSAQALGGHMNVHRRDRARLRQPLSPRSESTDEQHLSNLNTVSHLQAQFTSQQVYAPICNAKPNPNPNSSALVSSHPVSRVFSASTKKSSILDTLISASYSSYTTNPGSRIDSLHVPASTVPELKLGRESLKRKGEDYCGERGRFHDDEKEEKEEEEEEEHLGRKRRRLNPVLPFFVKAAVDEQELLKSKVLELAHNNVEEIDLELRLGDRPKVKENSIDLS